MAIHRVVLEWTGFQGAPGYSNFYFANEADEATATESRSSVSQFINELRPIIPTDVEVRVSTEIANIDQESGMVTDFVQLSTGGDSASGQGSGGYSAASGAVITWLTNGVRNGRRVRGRTFIVPLAGSAYQDDGTLTDEALQDLNDAGEILTVPFDGTGFGVWGRPGAAGDGLFFPAVGHRVRDRVAVLRSRRD